MKTKVTIQPKLKLSDLFIKINKGNYKCSEFIFKSGRYSLYNIVKTVLEKKDIKKIYIPYFICNEVIEGIKSFDLDIVFYDITENLIPDVESLKKYTKQFIIHNSKLFWNKVKLGRDEYAKKRI